jgi:hypothetical protein
MFEILSRGELVGGRYGDERRAWGGRSRSMSSSSNESPGDNKAPCSAERLLFELLRVGAPSGRMGGVALPLTYVPLLGSGNSPTWSSAMEPFA